MYLIVRTDLKMGKGKIAAQCCHAVQYLTMNNINKKSFKLYINNGTPKIVLKAPTLEVINNINNYCYKNGIPYYEVVDAGRTQIPRNTKTVIGVGPIKRLKVPYIIKELKLL